MELVSIIFITVVFAVIYITIGAGITIVMWKELIEQHIKPKWLQNTVKVILVLCFPLQVVVIGLSGIVVLPYQMIKRLFDEG